MVIFCGSFKELPELTLAGKVAIKAPNRHFSRKPSEYILYLVTKGQMDIREEEDIYSLREGDGILFDPTREHVGIASNHSVSYYYLHFQWEGFLENSGETDSYGNQDDLDRTEFCFHKTYHLQEPFRRGVVEQIENILRAENRMGSYQRILQGCQLTQVLIAIQENNKRDLGHPENSLDGMQRRIRDYIREHYFCHISSEEIGKACHGNFDYLNRRFKEDTGKTIFQLLKEIRLEESKKMIRSGAYSMSQISDACGFCNPYYFSRVFRKEFHMTPMEYRKQFR